MVTVVSKPKNESVLPEPYLEWLYTHTHTHTHTHSLSCSVFSVSPHQQDYRWWWRTFLVSGGSAFYVLIYAVFYFINKVKSSETVSSVHNKLSLQTKSATTELSVF